MIRLFGALLAFGLMISGAFGCMQGSPSSSGGSGSSSTPSSSQQKSSENVPAANNDRGALRKFGGDSLNPSDYNGNFFNQKGGGPVKKASELDCDFENVCCWQNEQAPADKLEWLLVRGSADSSKFGSNMGSSSLPSGNFLALPVDGKAPPSDAGQFYSCSIACAKEDVTVSLKHWETKGVKLQVCEKDAFDASKAPTNCKTISGSNQGKTTKVKLPPAQFFDVVIVASNFVDSAGGLAAIDDLKVDFVPCGGSTTPKKGTTPAAGGGECKALACNFESGDPCAYSPLQGSSGSGSQSSSAGTSGSSEADSGKWQVRSDRLGNRDTGVPGPGEKQKYLGTHLYPGQSAVLQSKDFALPDARILTMDYYEATEGIVLKTCRNGVSECEPISNPSVSVADRQWQKAQVNLPKDTKKVSIVAENTGQNIGSVGVDDISVAQADGSKRIC